MLKILKTKDSIENKEDIKKNLTKLASNNVIANTGKLCTYPIKRLKDNTKFIYLVYTLLNEHIKMGIPIHPAGEWLLDNYYIIEKASKTIQKDLTKKKYKSLPSLLDNSYDRKFVARVYCLANEIVSNTDGKIEKEELIEFINAYQLQKELNMEELWNIGLFLQISLIEKIREIAEKIFVSQTQKYRAESIIEKLNIAESIVSKLNTEKSNLKDSDDILHQERNLKDSDNILHQERNLKDSDDILHQETEPKITASTKNIRNRLIYKINKKINSTINNNPIYKRTNKTTPYPFIEHMSFKLKQLGEQATQFQEVFEEEVEKTGSTVSNIISREHFDVALKTLSMKNAITSIKNLSRMNLLEVFSKTNMVEQTLNQDPAGVYENMDFETKAYYRNEIIKLSKKTKISEIFIANKIIEMCAKQKELYERDEIQISSNSNENTRRMKKTHVGYYLLDDGRKALEEKLFGTKTVILSNETKSKIYIFSIYLVTNIIIALLFVKYKVLALILAIPIQNIVTKLIQLLLSKIIRPKLVPKINIKDDLNNEQKTICVCPTILKNEDDVEKMFEKLEVYYLANKSKNLYFALLGDCTSESKESTVADKKIISKGLEITNTLNQKYQDVFSFFYRKREWNTKEGCFMGWERKRGLLTNLNEFLATGKNNFLSSPDTNFFKENKIKYVITIDEDTNLILGSVKKLVGAMEHILNKPEVDKVTNKVVKGHGIIQPRILIDLDEAYKTKFSKIFTKTTAGLDIYTNAISDTYQDNFDEGIYTGKGIYDLQVFHKLLNNQIKENTILSHDLLEGSILRCALASDIILMDSYPSNYNSYKTRKHRWIRGDVQLMPYLKSNINTLSKYKIIDNLNRNLNEICLLLGFLVSAFQKKFLLFPLIVMGAMQIINIINSLIFAKSDNEIAKAIKINVKEYAISIITLVDIAYLEINAWIKAIYRTFISHKNMLEWTTSKDAEESSESGFASIANKSIIQIITAILMIIYTVINIQNISTLNITILLVIDVLWLAMPALMYEWSKKRECKIKLKKSEKEYLVKIASLTWNFFKENLNNNLPIDNYQEDRKIKKAMRTSPTNIGMYLMATMASYDLGIESLENTIERIENTVSTLENIPKWNGHLYNWYDIETLLPMYPYDISSVDSGNFIGYMIVAKEFLKEIMKPKNIEIQERNNIIVDEINRQAKKYNNCTTKKDNELSETKNKADIKIEIVEIEKTIEKIEQIIDNTDFSKLYDKENGLLSIGFNVEQNKLYDSYYDLLASEARQASIIAIAKKDVEEKHFQNLGRTLTTIKSKKCLVSWGGTAFEYLMPNINIKTYPETIIDESQKMLVKSQIMYSSKLNIPWGISEAAFSLKDFYGNYQYKTFGIPWLGLKRNLGNDAVVSPYSTALALTVYYDEAFSNLKRLDKEGAIGKYGFYDSIDYKPQKELIKTFMAHHQGMIIASIDNCINDNIFQKRFLNDKKIRGTISLLQEKMPDGAVIKEKKDKAKKLKYDGYEEPIVRTKGLNVISTNNLTNMITDKKTGFTKLDDILINNGMKIYIKNLTSNEIYDIEKMHNENSKVEFLPYKSKIIEEDGKLKFTQEITIAPLSKVEIRKMTLQNKTIEKQSFEVTTYEEPILSTKEQYEAHKVFDKMFLKFEEENNSIKVTRNKRTENERGVVEYVSIISRNDDGTNLEYEIDKENFEKRGIHDIPEAVKTSQSLTCKITSVLNPIIAMRKRITLDIGEEKEIYVIRSIGYEENKVRENFEEYKVQENLERVFELSKSQTKAETRYMNLSETQIAKYQKLLEKIYCKKKRTYNKEIDLSRERLWRYGISGDYPIILVKLKDYNDYYLAEEAFKIYEYYKTKNIFTEMCIMSNVNITDNVIGSQMEKFLNKRQGIFLINVPKKETRKLLEERASIIISTSNL